MRSGRRASIYESSWRLPPAHFRNGAGSILKICLTYVASVTQAETVTALGETTSHHTHRTAIFPYFSCCFLFRPSIFVFRVCPTHLRIESKRPHEAAEKL